jgi:hypothetical protein
MAAGVTAVPALITEFRGHDFGDKNRAFRERNMVSPEFRLDGSIRE